MDAPAQWDEPGKEAYRTAAIAEIRRSGGTISDSATYEEVRRYQAGFQPVVVAEPAKPVAASAAPAALSARRAASDAHAEAEQRKQLSSAKRKRKR